MVSPSVTTWGYEKHRGESEAVLNCTTAVNVKRKTHETRRVNELRIIRAGGHQSPDPHARAQLRALLKVAHEDVLCLTMARLEEEQGHRFLLASLARLRHTLEWRRLRFVWIGDGALRARLIAAVAEQKLTDHVFLLGQRQDTADWLSAADMFLLTSMMEGMPLAVMEAMAKGLPVAAAAVNGTPEVLGGTGRLLTNPLRHPDALVRELHATVSEWATNADLRKEIGSLGRERAALLFRGERMLEQTHAVIERALQPTPLVLTRSQPSPASWSSRAQRSASPIQRGTACDA
jgi:glycosyltransferase involved in cell wall biosynthesis